MPGSSPDGHRDVVAVLVGGEARRLGGLWKPGLWWNGRSILQRRLGQGASDPNRGTPNADVLLAGELPTSADPIVQRCIDLLIGDVLSDVRVVADRRRSEDGRSIGPGGVVAALVEAARGSTSRLAIMAGDVCTPIQDELALLRSALDADSVARGAVVLASDGAPIWDRSLWNVAGLPDAPGDALSPPLWKVVGAAARNDRAGLAVVPHTGARDIDTPQDLAEELGLRALRVGVLDIGGTVAAGRLRTLREVWAGHQVEIVDPAVLLDRAEIGATLPFDVVAMIPADPA